MPTTPQVDSPTQATHPQLPPHSMPQTHSDVKPRELDSEFGVEGGTWGGANGPPSDSGYVPFLDPHEGESSSEDSNEEETFTHNRHHSKFHPPSRDPFQSYTPPGQAPVSNHSRVDPFAQFESPRSGEGAKVTVVPPKEEKLIDWSFSEHQESGVSDQVPPQKQERGGLPTQQQVSSSKQPGTEFGSFDLWQTAPSAGSKPPRGPATGNLLGFQLFELPKERS